MLQRATLLRMGHLASLVLAANALTVAVGAARLRSLALPIQAHARGESVNLAGQAAGQYTCTCISG